MLYIYIYIYVHKHIVAAVFCSKKSSSALLDIEQ